MSRSIQNIVFDLGGVLLEWKPDQILARLYPEAPKTQALIKKEVFQHPDWLALDKGTLDEEAAILLFQRRTGRPLSEIKKLIHCERDPHPHSADVRAFRRAVEGRDESLLCVEHAGECLRLSSEAIRFLGEIQGAGDLGAHSNDQAGRRDFSPSLLPLRIGSRYLCLHRRPSSQCGERTTARNGVDFISGGRRLPAPTSVDPQAFRSKRRGFPSYANILNLVSRFVWCEGSSVGVHLDRRFL